MWTLSKQWTMFWGKKRSIEILNTSCAHGDNAFFIAVIKEAAESSRAQVTPRHPRHCRFIIVLYWQDSCHRKTFTNYYQYILGLLFQTIYTHSIWFVVLGSGSTGDINNTVQRYNCKLECSCVAYIKMAFINSFVIAK